MRSNKRAITYCKSLGLRCRWSSEWLEFKLWHPSQKDPDEGYFTSDIRDLIDTATAMAEAYATR